MSQQEKDTFGSHENYNSEALEKLRDRHQEILREKLEKSVENKHENQETNARHEALEQAQSIERKNKRPEKEARSLERKQPATKRERKASYDKTMDEVHAQLSGPSRAFSNFIHNPVVEKVSDAIGNTVARPNAILSGSLFAFLFTLAIYLIARLYGYPLSGAETIASFILGWIVGLIFDYIRLLAIGKNR